MTKKELEDFERYYKDCRKAAAKIGKYVDKNLRPLSNDRGEPLFEEEVLKNLSPKARKLGRELFYGIIAAARREKLRS